MCGIVGYVGSRPCAELLLEGLARLEYRGYDSAGLAVHDGEQVHRLRAEGKLAGLERLCRQTPLEGTCGVGHTRWATHGRPSEDNAHPHRVDDIIVVHNGIIENHAELRRAIEARGGHFASETDTEVLAHLIAEARREAGTSLVAAVRKTLAQVRGSWALVVLDAGSPDRLVAARQASPLVIGRGEGEMFAASDVPAILRHTRQVLYLEDGDVALLEAGGVVVEDALGAPVERPEKRITWDPISAEKQGYKHFMLKEIHEQPDRLVDTLRGRLSVEEDRVVLDVLDALPGMDDITQVILLACGTSYHAGLVGQYLIEELARVPARAELASEFRYRNPVLDARTLVIPISQSGETADTLAALATARQAGARTVAICNVMESSITRNTEATIYTQAGPEIGVASTKAYTTQLAALTLVALWLGQQRDTLTAGLRGELLRGLRELPGLQREVLAEEDRIRETARAFLDARSFLFLGRGLQFPTALEGALKLKEISYIHAEGYAAGEMKHGPIALIDEHMPVLVLAPADRLQEKTLSNLQEVRARGGRLIVVGDRANPELAELAEHVLHLPTTHELLSPMLSVLPLQLLSYAVADALGTDVDQPRNLAKSVTVE